MDIKKGKGKENSKDDVEFCMYSILARLQNLVGFQFRHFLSVYPRSYRIASALFARGARRLAKVSIIKLTVF